MSPLTRAGVLNVTCDQYDDPTYAVDGVVHYCVANMPGSVPLTSSEALNNATLPHVLALAEHGVAGSTAPASGQRSEREGRYGDI